jgi:hypothetical protein
LRHRLRSQRHNGRFSSFDDPAQPIGPQHERGAHLLFEFGHVVDRFDTAAVVRKNLFANPRIDTKVT